MEEKKYLKLGNKIAYGCGDMGANFCYSFIGSYVLLYLTTVVGLNSGIIGTLMLVSRVFDGITDVLFGTLIDNTKSKWGKARPWMLFTTPLMVIAQIMLFSIPEANEVFQYAYFFVIYTLLNDVFYTAANVAYGALSVLITKNKNERVELGAFRYVFAAIAGIVLSFLTVTLVDSFGGGAIGWRNVAILYSLFYAILTLITVFGIKEIEVEEEKTEETTKGNMVRNLIALIKNPYFLLQLGHGIVFNLQQGLGAAVGIYYMTYVLGDASYLGFSSICMLLFMIIGMVLSPLLVKKVGSIYKANMYGLIFSLILSIPFVYFGMNAVFLPVVVIFGMRWLGFGPCSANMLGIQAEIATYTQKTQGINVTATVFSCGTMASKIGNGLGTAISGWLLALAAFDGSSTVQSAECNTMIAVMYVVIPSIATLVDVILSAFLKVEFANIRLNEEA